jgi:8-oxo-dGTP diphosphatase
MLGPVAPAPSRLIVAAAVVDDLERPSRVLAARRRGPAELAGMWELPGGKVEAGETPIAALRRELAEELGVAVEAGDLVPGPLPDLTWPLPGGRHMRVWLAAVTSRARQNEQEEQEEHEEKEEEEGGGGEAHGIPAAGEAHDEVRWLTRAELHDVPWLAPDLPIVAALSARMVGSVSKA